MRSKNQGPAVLPSKARPDARNLRLLSRLTLATIAVVALTGLVASLAHAQQVYRIVGPDGKVTFSDKPPVTAAAQVSTPSAAENAGSGSTSLPFELRQVASRFPVTLYTGPNCEPCGAARGLLSRRGVPFTERTVTSNDDVAALRRLSGEASLPFGTIGAQQLKGYSDAEWTQFLDAAGYPATSSLPATYRAPAATPLVAVAPAAAPAAGNGTAAAAGTAAPRTRVVTPPVPENTNPAGIKF
ncbi:MAG: glutaredoxin family protein [Comamonadaceae bacterium]|nr:MAG: glutaredoxin family protein [Comamonadaceae bacterium]